jgi:hypothetical protein
VLNIFTIRSVLFDIQKAGRDMSVVDSVLPLLGFLFVAIHASLWITYIIKPFDIAGELKGLDTSARKQRQIEHSPDNARQN